MTTTPMRLTEEASLSQLVTVYNTSAALLGETQVKKFADKKTALRRTQAIVARLEATSPVAEEEATPVAEEGCNGSTGGINFLGMRNDILARADAPTPLKNENSIRAQCLALLRRGARKEELAAVFYAADARRGRETKDPTRRMYEMVRIFCYGYGWGSQTSEGGEVITLVAKGEERLPEDFDHSNVG